MTNEDIKTLLIIKYAEHFKKFNLERGRRLQKTKFRIECKALDNSYWLMPVADTVAGAWENALNDDNYFKYYFKYIAGGSK